MQLRLSDMGKTCLRDLSMLLYSLPERSRSLRDLERKCTHLKLFTFDLGAVFRFTKLPIPDSEVTSDVSHWIVIVAGHAHTLWCCWQWVFDIM